MAETKSGFPLIDNAGADSGMYVSDYFQLLTGNNSNSLVNKLEAKFDEVDTGIANLREDIGDDIGVRLEEVEVELNQRAVQCEVMPEASDELVGEVVQYIGENTSDYTTGFWYRCEIDENNEYVWVVSSGAGGVYVGNDEEIPQGYNMQIDPDGYLFIAGRDYQTPLEAGVDYQTPLTASVDYAKPAELHTVALIAGGWSGDDAPYTQSVNVANVVADESKQEIRISPAPSSYDAWGAAGIRCVVQGESSLTFQSKDIPEVDVVVNISVAEVSV